MNRNLLRRIVYLLFSFGLLVAISLDSVAQSFSYTSGALSVDITVINPCPTFGGAIEVTVNSTEGGANAQLVVIGPPTLFPAQNIPPGSTFTFNPSQTLPAGTYDWIIGDGTNTIGSLAFPTSPKIVLTDITQPTVTKDIETNNNSCVNPNGQIQASITGGSQMVGSPSYDYKWTSTNDELPALGFLGSTDGISPLNLASLLGKTGLKGGTYTLQVFDDFSQCATTAIFVITDPSPATQTLSPASPPAYNICSGDNIVLSLSGSEVGVTYEILRNGIPLPTPITFVGTGASPFPLSFSSTQFASGNNILVQATNGFCATVPMTGSVSLLVNPIPTASISGTSTICSGGSATLTFTLPASGTYNVVYTDGTTNFTANGISNGATVSVSPSSNTTFTIVSVTNTSTLCSVTAPSPNITGSAVVTVNPLPTASISGTSTICTGGTGVLTFTLSPGIYNVIYTDGTTNFNANGIANGATVNVTPSANTTYTIVSVSNTATTCSVTAPNVNITGSAAITVNPLPTASISGTSTICSGDNATLTFTLSAGTYDVVYSDGTSNFSANGIVNGATVNVTPTSNTTYSIVSIINTAISSCTVTAPHPNLTGSAVVTVNPSPTASISGSTTICSGGATILTFALPIGTYNVVYTDGTTNFNANGISNGATVNVSPSTSATYTIVSVTNTASLCTVIAPHANITGSAVINVNPLPTASISGTATICTGASTSLTFTLPAGTYNVVYTDGTTNFNANGIVNGATVNVSPALNTTYTIVSVTNVGTTCTVSAPSPNITGSAIISLDPLPTASIGGSATICSGENAILTFTLPGGTYDVVYTNGTINFNADGIANGATVNVSPTANTTYTIVSVINTATSCSVTAPSPNITGSATVAVDALPTASISGTATVCAGGTTALTFTLPVGTYNVVYTDGTTNFNANGIVTGATVNVTPASNTTYTIVSVSNIATTCIVSAPSANINGSAVVTVNPLPTASIAGSSTICSGNNAILTFTLSTGTYNVVYTDGTTNFNANGISSGATVNVAPTSNTTYSIVSITNTTIASCTVTAPHANITGGAIISVDPLPTASISGTATVCPGGNAVISFTLPAGTYDVVYTDGTTIFTASGINTGSTVNVAPSSTTTYTIVSVTNTATLCSATAPNTNITGSAIVTVNPLPTASLNGTATICSGTPTPLTFGLPAGTYDVVYTDGTTNFNASGIANGATVNVSPLVNTTYTIVSVTNTLIPSCTVSAPSPNVTGSAVITINSPTAAISGTASICSGGSTNLSFTLPAGTYNIVYTDGTTNFNANGITSGATVSVSPAVNTTYTIVSVTNTTTLCSATAPNPGITGSVAITITSGPVLAATQATTICDGESAAYEILLAPLNSPAGTVFNWLDPDGTGPATEGINVPMGAAGTTHINDVLTNSTGSPLTITYLVTPSVATCTGAAVPVEVTVLPAPNIGGVFVASACAGLDETILSFGSTTGSPDLYSIDFFDPAFPDEVDGILPAAPGQIDVKILTTASPGPYFATLTVRNSSTGCISAGIPITIGIIGVPTPIITGPVQVCLDAPSYDYTTLPGMTDYVWTVSGGDIIGSTTGNAINVTWNTSGPQSVTVVYTENTCAATTPGSLAVNVFETPSIIGVNIDPVCSNLPEAELTFSGVTGTPDEYTIDFDAIAETEGFIDITTTLPASSILIALPPSVSADIYNATLTVTNAAGCVSAAIPISIEVLPTPTATISGTASICSGSQTPVTINFTGTAPWSYEYTDGTNIFAGVSPANSITFNVSPLSNITYTLVSVNDSATPSCDGVISGTAAITVNQNPQTNLTVAVVPNPTCSGGSADVTVANSEMGVSYQLRNNSGNVNVGGPVVGDGNTITLSTGPLTSDQVFNVLATAAGCASAQLTGLANVTVNGTINAALAVTAVPNPICDGSTTMIQIANSENGVLYQLRNNNGDINMGGLIPGTGGTIDLPTDPLSDTTTFSVLASNGSCSIELTNLVTVNVNVNPDPTKTVTVVPDPICEGGSASITVATSQEGVTYQLRSEPGDVAVGLPVAGTGGMISMSTLALTSTTTFNILATSGACTPVVLDNHPIVTVSGVIDVTYAVTSSASPICQGSSVDIEVSNSDIGITYELRDALNASIAGPIAGTGSPLTFTIAILNATTTFNVLASNGTCSIQLTDTETVNVDVAPDAGLAVGTTLNPLCVGGQSQVTVAASQSGVTYQLRDDADDSAVGAPILSAGGTISFSTGVLSADKTFNILATSGGCPPVELTQKATITVAGTINAGLTVTSSASSLCSGSGTFIQVLLSEAGVDYSLRNDGTGLTVGLVQAGNGGTLNFPTGNLPAAPNTVTYSIIADNGTCSIALTDTETITINPAPDITLAVAPGSGLICSGTGTSINITGTQAGVTYELRIGTTVVGTVVSAGGNISIPTGNLTASTTYNVLATSGTCSAQLTATASVAVRVVGDPACGGGGSDCANFSAIIPTIVTQPSCNDRDAGEVSFSISRSDATATTFRVIWSINGTDQTKFTSNTVSFDDLSSGLYQYTIIDEGNGKTCGPVDFFLDLSTQVTILDKQVTASVTCYDGTDGNVILTVDGTTTGEYWYRYVLDGQESFAQTFTPGAPLPGGLPADDDDFIIIKVDQSPAFSCPDTVMVRINHTYPQIDFTVASTEVTTCNGIDGAIQVTGIAGGNTTTSALQIRLKKEVPFSTDPSGYITVSDFEVVNAGAKEYADLSQGNYIIDVRDESDCIRSKPIAIQAPGQVPLAFVDIVPTDASCANEGASGSIQVTINQPGIYEVAVSQDQVNVPADDQFVAYNSPSLPNITFNNLIRGRYFLYIKSSTTQCPTRSDFIAIGGVYAVGDFDIISNCENVNLTLNNISGEEGVPFTIEVFNNNDKFFKIATISETAIPLSNSISINYTAPLTNKFLTEQGTYRFVMIQEQTTGAGTCMLVSDTVVYDVRPQIGIVLGLVKPSFPEPKRTGSIEVENIIGGTRFVSGTNELSYEISLSTADDDIVVFDWAPVNLNPQNKFSALFDYIAPGVYRIKVRDATGCVRVQDVEVTLDPSVYVPNIFTPNDDAINDEFEILNLPLQGKHALIVSNRWGNQVFTSKDYREGNFWNAEGASDGIYFYRLKVEGGETYTGWVEILRGNKP